MKKGIYTLICLFVCQAYLFGQPDIELESFATGFFKPIDISHANDARLFVTQQNGIIRIIGEDGLVYPDTFLNIVDRVNASGNERGLLGLAFHPSYADNGYFYVNYTGSGGATYVSRFSVMADNPDKGDPNSELILLTISQPFSNHNGGKVAFGHDGYLYIGMGDGGSANDPVNAGQTASTLLGKMLRIDVDNQAQGLNYAIPADNPFASPTDGILDEIWAFGMRNPWRFSFDRLTGDLWIGDVGQNQWEEINFQPADSPGGENYGWRCYEGNNPFNTSGCGPQSNYVFPAYAYSHSATGGCSVTGGYVYRGCDYPNLYGYYFFADYCNGQFWAMAPDDLGGWAVFTLSNLSNVQYTTFGENYAGELFVSAHSEGKIYRVKETGATPFEAPVIQWNDTLLSVPSGFASYQWYLDGEPIDGAIDSTFLPLESGAYSLLATNIAGCEALSESVFVVIQSIEELVPAPFWRVSPNPFKDFLHIRVEADRVEAGLFEIYSATGRLVWQGVFADQSIDATAWPAGMYWLRLQGKEGAMKVYKGL